MDGQCLKSYLQVVLNELKKHQFNEDFIKSYNDDSGEGRCSFPEVDVQYPEIYMAFTII